MLSTDDWLKAFAPQIFREPATNRFINPPSPSKPPLRGESFFTRHVQTVWVGSTQGEGRVFLVGRIINADDDADNSFFSLKTADKKIEFGVEPDQIDDLDASFQVEIHLDDILNKGLALTATNNVTEGGYDAALTISLRRPPKVIIDLSDNPLGKRKRTRDQSDWYRRRSTEMDWCAEADEPEAGPVTALPWSGQRANLQLNFGQWLSYRIFFWIRNRDLEALRDAISRLRTSERPDFQPESLDRLMSNSFVIQNTMDAPEATIVRVNQLRVDYEIRFLITGLITRGIVLASEFGQVWKRIKLFSPQQQIWILKCMYKSERISNFEKTIRDLSRSYTDKKAAPSEHQVAVRRILVTPTRVLPCPPEMETSNRVLRKFREHLDRFARVQFTDESGEKFYVDGSIRETHEDYPDVGPLARFEVAMKEGVVVSGRHYTFLGYSDGMAREGQAWFVAEAEGLTANGIRQWMGDFSKEKIVAKHAARIGLCFSSTRLVGDVEIELIDDIQHGKFVYTDGIGLISEELAKRCAEIMGMPDTVPSAVQVRFAGFKGMLAVSGLAKGNRVLARPSMRKFEADHMTMGLCTVSTYSRGFLSRQSILLLESLGVHRSNFRALFDEQMERAKGLISNDPRYCLEAYRKLGRRRAKKMTTFPVGLLLEHGFQNETLLVNVLQVLGCRLLHDLKYKASLEVKEAVHLLGIADELGVLEEGEVYCAIQDPDGDIIDRQVVTGPCTIFRSPALHPGDIQRVSAVDVPELAHLVNVVVFSTKPGSRDLPSMLGGGDLDGDTFTLIWDKRFVIPEGRSHEPMDYSAPKSDKVPDVTIDQVQEFFIDYMKFDVLGRVSTAHMAAADMAGPTCSRAIELAHLASRAADFAKTGVPAECPEWMDSQLSPDFMEKSPRWSYESSKILGELYRLIDPAPQLDPLTTMYCDPRFIDFAPPRDTYLRRAGALKRQYDIELGGIMRRYGMAEAEVVGGMGVVPAERRKRREKDDNLRGPVKEAFDELVRSFQQEALQWCQDHPIPLQNARESFAIAAYLCTNDETYRQRYVESSPEDDEVSVSSYGGGDDYALEQGDIIQTHLLSFPYLFVRELIEAVKGLAQRPGASPW